MTPARSTATGDGPLLARPSGHVWSIDILRLLTFTAVISVHTVAFTQDPTRVGVNGALMILQFGREIFFSITGFVLVYSTLGRPVEARSLWRRRVPYVIIPYLTWTAVYYAVDLVIAPYPAFSWHTLGLDVADGNAFYHLYFLLVSAQLYLVFPWLIRGVRATARHPFAVLGTVGALNMVWLWLLHYRPTPTGTLSWFWNHGYEILPTYSVYVLGGCYAALHVTQLQDALRRRPGRALALAAASIGVALGFYAWQLRTTDPRTAGAVLQPAMVAACLGAVIVLGLVGTRWADGPQRGRRAVTVGSDISFGVYLAHPLVLTVLLNNGLGNTAQKIPALPATLLAFVVTVVGASALSVLARRTPLSLLLTGRAWRAGPSPTAAPVAVASVAAS